MSLLALPHELVHQVSAYLHCIDRYHLVLALLSQMGHRAATLLAITAPPGASRSELIKFATEWKEDQIAAQLGVHPLQFWAKEHHHCFHCRTLLKTTIVHYAKYSFETVYRIKVNTDLLYNPRARTDLRLSVQVRASSMFNDYLHFSYASPGYGCGGCFERVDVVTSPAPTELHKECATCHLKARSTVSNTCRLCARDYGVLPCSCGAKVCIMCLQSDYHRAALAPLCHRCLRITCALCVTSCNAPGCSKWLCVACKDIPQECALTPVKAAPVLAAALAAETSEEESDLFSVESLFGD